MTVNGTKDVFLGHPCDRHEKGASRVTSRESSPPRNKFSSCFAIAILCAQPGAGEQTPGSHLNNASIGAEMKMMACHSVTVAHTLVTWTGWNAELRSLSKAAQNVTSSRWEHFALLGVGFF